jgi:hypothetical protein
MDYAGISEDYDPANRTSAGAAIRAARERGCARMCALTDAGAESWDAKTWKPRRADERIRTADPFITSEVLYQLSYVGSGGNASRSPRPQGAVTAHEPRAPNVPAPAARTTTPAPCRVVPPTVGNPPGAAESEIVSIVPLLMRSPT